MAHIRPDRWYFNYDAITEFGAVLANSGLTVGELQYYYEKPWKWAEDHARWEEAGSPDIYEDEELETRG